MELVEGIAPLVAFALFCAKGLLLEAVGKIGVPVADNELKEGAGPETCEPAAVPGITDEEIELNVFDPVYVLELFVATCELV